VTSNDSFRRTHVPRIWVHIAETVRDGRWAHHEVVVKVGRVYDAFTGHKGATISEYKSLWEHADAIKFGF
jgi:hypothetical protein